MNFYGSLGDSKRSPRKHRQTEVDSRGIQCICGIGYVDTEALFGIELSCLNYQSLSEVCINAPIAGFVGVCQGGSTDRSSKTHVIKLCSLSRQAGFDIAETLPIGKLGESHYSKLLGTAKTAHPMVAAVFLNGTMKSAPWEKVHDLGKQGFAGVHRHLRNLRFQQHGRYAVLNPSRHHQKCSANPYPSWYLGY